MVEEARRDQSSSIANKHHTSVKADRWKRLMSFRQNNDARANRELCLESLFAGLFVSLTIVLLFSPLQYSCSLLLSVLLYVSVPSDCV